MKPVVVDCKGHLKGRLASVVAKQLLKGQKIVLVRCEETNVAGTFIRNKIIHMRYLNKTMRSNPRRGHRHQSAPSLMVFKAIRGMLPHKTTRGANALKNLRVYDGVPTEYEKVKKMVIPAALRVQNLRAGSKYIRLGDLAVQIGWKYGDVVSKLEKKRLARGAAFHSRRTKVAVKQAAIVKQHLDRVNGVKVNQKRVAKQAAWKANHKATKA
ncbi:putative 60S ribosomal protein L16 [Blattamonas nauphoetae]|uniref:60S ribosomal protein L16 n=1 Tax=Blattamonas nauphoetae TaxID=2049346 RepID=A0ABQ9YCP3_9EUKA|nr:putative 60S ribosomal protein L16 [Blattamonas nauphoetae]